MPKFNNMESRPPFEAVSTETFEEVRRIERDIEIAKKMIVEDEDRATVANLLEGMILDENTPRASKLKIFSEMVKLQDGYDRETSEDVCSRLIDIIRLLGSKEDDPASKSDPDLRSRYLAIMSHDLQVKYLPGELTQDNLATTGNRIDVLRSIAKNHREKGHRAFAKYILNPPDGSGLEVLNELYDKRNTQDMEEKNVDRPLVDEDLDRYSDEPEESAPKNEGTIFTGDIIKLNPMRLPSQDKIDTYRSVTGRDLPVYVVRHSGSGRFAVTLPRQTSSSLVRASEFFRQRVITRKEVFDIAEDAGARFVRELTPKQRKEYENARLVEIRFGTEKSENPEYQHPPLIAAEEEILDAERQRSADVIKKRVAANIKKEELR